MTPNEIETYVGSTAFQSVRSLMSKAWRTTPTHQPVDDATVAATIEAEWGARKHAGEASTTRPSPALSFLPDAPDAWNPAPAPEEQGAYQYYDAFAEHMRSQHEKPHSGFVGLLPQVRITLPELPPADSVLARTAIGFVFTQDHLLASMSAVRSRMIQRFGAAYADITRVDVISPARLGSRFGAIGLYLGYRAHQALPSFFVLEAGLATGPSVRLFFSPDMSKIVHAPTSYLPTPFVELSNTYDGALIMNGEHPQMLIVESFREPRTAVGARIHVNVTYEQRTASSVTKLAPGDITLMAAERIAAVGHALGESAIELQGLLAPAGQALAWIKKPV
jgi:hypothetical protein